MDKQNDYGELVSSGQDERGEFDAYRLIEADGTWVYRIVRDGQVTITSRMKVGKVEVDLS